ncbi:hypothetical protein BJF90_35975 [Pseudonocardia sp. CNS-004]|nr:hypothetical protein BJF90_35975 [Pseudonocardia sp. CNS-004]
MMAIRSASASASAWSWVTYTLVSSFSTWIRRSSMRRSSRSRASRLDSGSSSSMTAGRIAMLRASATRCIWPPLSLLAPRSARCAIPTRASTSSAALRASALGLFAIRSGKATFSTTVRCGHTA